MMEFTQELKERPVAFVKFSFNKERLESIQKGNLYLNTLGYFKELEKATKTKGMGDQDEASLVFTNTKLSIYDNNTGQLIFEGPSSRNALCMDEDCQKHVLCMSYLDLNDFEIIDVGNDYFEAQTSFTKEQRDDFINNFGDFVLFISCNDFIENLTTVFKSEGISWAADKVKYDDFSINHSSRIESYMSRGNSKYFWKDIFFKNQKEYRVIILNRDSNEPLKITVGDMSNYSYIMSATEFFDSGLRLLANFDPDTDIVEI